MNFPLFFFAQSIGSLWQAVKRRFRQWTKPINDAPVPSRRWALTAWACEGGAYGQDRRRQRPQAGGAVRWPPGRPTGGSAKPGAHTAGGGRGASVSPVHALGDGDSATLLRGEARAARVAGNGGSRGWGGRGRDRRWRWSFASERADWEAMRLQVARQQVARQEAPKQRKMQLPADESLQPTLFIF